MKRVKLPPKPSSLETAFRNAWLCFSPRPFGVTEHRFHPVRDWRFDVAWPEQKVAVELHGGTWSRGRHVRPTGIQGDCHKLNSAVIRGWRVLVYTSDDLSKRPADVVREVCELLGAKAAGN